jgi:hypothetical protein
VLAAFIGQRLLELGSSHTMLEDDIHLAGVHHTVNTRGRVKSSNTAIANNCFLFENLIVSLVAALASAAMLL